MVAVLPPPSVSNVIEVKNSVPSILLKFNLVAKNKSFWKISVESLFLSSLWYSIKEIRSHLFSNKLLIKYYKPKV